MSSTHRRKLSSPRRLHQPLPDHRCSVAMETEPVELATRCNELPSSRLQQILSSLSRLYADLAPKPHQSKSNSANIQSAAASALQQLAAAHKQLLAGLDLLRSLETTQTSLTQTYQTSCSESEATSMAITVAPAIVKGRKPISAPDKVDPTFVPQLSADGRIVTLSASHPSASMPAEAHQRLLWASHGVATLHLRGLMKHFFTREVLAQSSVSGVGAYKQPLNKDIVMGICDYISKRYPGALTDSRMRLCCTDVCVQARRRRRSRGSASIGSAAAAADESC